MTDIYVRRPDSPDPRRRAALFAAVLLLAAVAGIAAYRFGCRGPAEAAAPAEAQPESDPLIDELLALPEAAPAAGREPLAEPAIVSVPTRAPAPALTPATSQTSGSRAAVTAAVPVAVADLPEQVHPRATTADLLDVRAKALAVLAAPGNEAALARTRDLLGEVNIRLILAPHPTPEKIEYIVRPGDNLDKLARQHHTTIELIQKGNDLSGTIIRPGDRLRILQAAFRIEVDKSDNILDVFLGDAFFKRYRVGTGEYNKTPVGEFKITDRIQHPPWWRPDGKVIPYGDPDNELGTHWLSLNVRGYGLHGTWKPETVGQQSSAGCIRLLNDDIEELYTLAPVGTPVTIRD